MRTTLRWTMRLIGVAAFCFCLYVLLQWWLLPRVVKQQVAGVLHGLGLQHATFEVEDANWHGVRLGRIRLEGDTGGGGADLLEVSYAPLEVIRGKVQRVRVTGAELELKIGPDGRVDFGALGRVNRPADDSAATPQPAAPLPFNSVEIQSSSLKLNWEGRAALLPVDGTVTAKAPGQLALTLTTAFQGSEIRVEGAIHTATGDADLTLAAPRLAVAPVIALMPQDFTAGGRFNAWGTAKIDAHYVRAKGAGKLSASLGGYEGPLTTTFAGHRAAWEQLRFKGEATIAQQNHLSASLESKLARVDNQPVENVKLQVEGDPAGPLAATLEFSNGQYAVEDTLRVAGLTLKARAQRDAAGALTATADLSGKEYEQETVARLLDFSATLRASLPAGADSLTLAPETELRVRRLTSLDPAWQVTFSPDAAEALTLQLTAPLSFNWRDPAHAWSATVGGAKVALAAPKLTAAGAQLSAANGVLLVQGTASDSEADVSVMKGSNLAFGRLTVGSGDAESSAAAAAHVGPLSLAIDVDRLGLLHAARTDRGGWNLSGSVNVAPTTPLTADAAGRRVQATVARLQGTYAMTPAGRLGWAGELTLHDGKYEDPAAGLAITGVAGTLPASWSAPALPAKELSIAGLRVAGADWPGLTAKVSFADGRVDASADWEPVPQAKTHLAGWVNVAAGPLRGQVSADVPPFTITSAGDVASRLTQIGDAQVTGTFALTGTLALDGSHLEPTLSAKVDNATVSSVHYDFALEGVSADLKLTSLDPLRTPGSQKASVKKMRFGKAEFVDGAVQFRSEAADSLFVESVAFGWAGGRVYATAFRIDPAKPVLDTVVYADGLNVADVLKIAMSEPTITGSGTVYGRLPVKISADRATFGDGFLYATPGEQSINLGNKAAAVAEQVPGTFKAGGQDVKVQEPLTAALKDFRYDILRTDFRNVPGKGLVASTTVRGQGANNGAKLDLSLGISGIDRALNNALLVRRSLESVGKGKP